MNTIDLNKKYRKEIMVDACNSLIDVMNLIFASHYFIIEIDATSGGFSPNGVYSIRFGIGTPDQDNKLFVNGEDSFDLCIKATDIHILESYFNDPLELMKGPGQGIIGIPKKVLSEIDFSCEEYEDDPIMILNNIYYEDGRVKFNSSGEIPSNIKKYCIEVSVPRSALKEVKQLSDEHIFRYLAFYIFVWLGKNPGLKFDSELFEENMKRLTKGVNTDETNNEIKETSSREEAGDNL